MATALCRRAVGVAMGWERLVGLIVFILILIFISAIDDEDEDEAKEEEDTSPTHRGLGEPASPHRTATERPGHSV